MCNLGKYHARNIHQWEGGSCDFHSLKTCICKRCNDDDELICDGIYATKNPLTCPLHALAYEIECDECASHAHELIQALPLFDGMEEALRKANDERAIKLTSLNKSRLY